MRATISFVLSIRDALSEFIIYLLHYAAYIELHQLIISKVLWSELLANAAGTIYREFKQNCNERKIPITHQAFEFALKPIIACFKFVSLKSVHRVIWDECNTCLQLVLVTEN